MALLQYAESGDARKSRVMNFSLSTRPYNLTSYEDEAEKHEHVLAPVSEEGQDPVTTSLHLWSRAGVGRGVTNFRPDCEGMWLCN
jgi:hypothetical protein